MLARNSNTLLKLNTKSPINTSTQLSSETTLINDIMSKPIEMFQQVSKIYLRVSNKLEIYNLILKHDHSRAISCKYL